MKTIMAEKKLAKYVEEGDSPYLLEASTFNLTTDIFTNA